MHLEDMHLELQSKIRWEKNPIEQLEASKSSFKDLFSDVLDETKGFKYQIMLKVMLKKFNPNGEIEFAPIYCNSTTKAVINHKFSLENALQEILYKIDNWINEGSGWNVELIESQYINISTYRPLSGSSFVQLRVKFKSPKEWLINIKNNDQKWFLWCHVRYINPEKIHPELHGRLGFLCKKKILSRLRPKKAFALTCIVMKTGWFFQSFFQIKNLKIQWISCL